MAGTEYFGQTAVQPRDHIPVNTIRKSHNHTLSRQKKKNNRGGGGGKIVIILFTSTSTQIPSYKTRKKREKKST